MNDAIAATAFAALGSPNRVSLLRLLVQAGKDGMNVSQLREATGGTPATTLTHHLSKLVASHLVTQERVGRELRCHAAYHTIQALGAFLMEDCCRGVFPAAVETRCRDTDQPALGER